MDISEGDGDWKGTKKTDFPPLYESVTDKDPDNGSMLCHRINRALLPFKMYYLFFYGAIGSLFPFLALYFKHLWLSPTQAGFLVGLRPIVQSMVVPLWGICADKFRVRKAALLIGLCGWLFVHVSILLVPPGEKPSRCYDNATMKRSFDERLGTMQKAGTDHENDAREWPNDNDDSLPPMDFLDDHAEAYTKNLVKAGISKRSQTLSAPFITDDVNSTSADQENHSNEARSSNVEHVEKSLWIPNTQSMNTWHTFAYLSLIIVVGNIFAAPAQTMANTITLHALSTDTHKYGAQRYFGSIGWGFASFVIGMLVSMNHDQALACKDHDDINYTPCFYAFGIFMLLALIVALFFKANDGEKSSKEKDVKVCYSLYGELDCLTCYVLFTAFLAGFSMGFIQTFLFWYLQSIGGTQVLFSTMTGVNAIGEMIGFMLSVKLIDRFGHLRVLSFGLAAYSIRLLVYGLVNVPWAILPVEILKAFTSSAVWASILSFIGVSNGSAATLLSLVHMLYWGVGYGGAGVIGGILTERIGARAVFLALAIINLANVFLILILLNRNCCPKRTQSMYMPVVSDDDDDEVEIPQSEQ